MKSVIRAIRRMRKSGMLWLLAAAVLFLVGAARFDGVGMTEIAEVGVGAAIAAIAIVVACFG